MIADYLHLFSNIGIEILRNVATDQISKIKIGDMIPYLFAIDNIGQLQYLVQVAFKNDYNVVILGKCSNTVISKRNIDRILFVQLKGAYFYEVIFHKHLAKVGSSVYLPDFIHQCSHTQYCGMEKLIGIPGTVGGSVYMNAGVSQYSTGDFVYSVEVMYPNATIKILNKEDIVFQYRSSSLQKCLILSVQFELSKMHYRKTQSNISQALLSRKKTQPLSIPSLGSIFKNLPDISAWQLIQKFNLQLLSIGQLKISKKTF